MLKGIAQEKRNNAWHTKHLKKRTSFNIHRISRLLNYSSGYTVSLKNKKQATDIMERQRDRDLQKGFWNRIKLFFQRLFSHNKLANA